MGAGLLVACSVSGGRSVGSKTKSGTAAVSTRCWAARCRWWQGAGELEVVRGVAGAEEQDAGQVAAGLLELAELEEDGRQPVHGRGLVGLSLARPADPDVDLLEVRPAGQVVEQGHAVGVDAPDHLEADESGLAAARPFGGRS